MVGKLIYLVHTRTDIIFSIFVVNHFLVDPQLPHLNAVKQIFRYLKGTIDYGIFYKRGGNIELEAFVDVDWARDIEQQRSTSGFILKIGNSVVSWCEKRQSTMALSSAEAKYGALMEGTKEVIWLQGLLGELQHGKTGLTTLFYDNINHIKMAKNLVFHARTKHIECHYHFVWEKVMLKEIDIVHIATNQQHANVFTKPLGRMKFEGLHQAISNWNNFRISSCSMLKTLTFGLREGVGYLQTSNSILVVSYS
jgi:hypothetical protein